MVVRIPLPKATVSGSPEPLGPGQSGELRLNDKVYVWKIKKIDGGSEYILIIKVCVHVCTVSIFNLLCCLVHLYTCI